MDEYASAAARQMSLVPYSSDSREVVLRRGNAVVLYDFDSRQVSVRRAAEPPVELIECPYCRRPLHAEEVPVNGDEYGARPFGPEGPFVDPDYFAMLAASRRPSPRGSGQSTPGRRVIPAALRSGRSRDVSGADLPVQASEPAVIDTESAAPDQGISSSALSPGYFKQFFNEERELGRGGNGVVLLVDHIIEGISLGQFACKRIPVGDSRANLEKVIKEVRLLHTVSHRNLVAYHHTWLEDHQPSKFGPSIPCLWILQDYCNGGDLHRYVIGPKSDPSTTEQLKQKLRRTWSRGEGSLPRPTPRGSRMNLDEIVSFFKDVTSGLHHLHSKGYIHRDLKPSNCLLHHDAGRTRLLISDFGEVQVAGAIRSSSGATGTISYCAPEVVKQAPDGSYGNFTTKSDIFSLGMIVYFMCFGRLPYRNAVEDTSAEQEDMDELREEIIVWRGFKDDMRSRSDLPERLYKYLKRLLSVNPDERPTTDEILTSIKDGASALDDEEWTPETYDISTSQTHIGQPRRLSGLVSGTRPSLPSPTRHDTSEVVTSRSQSPFKNLDSRRSRSRPTSPTETSLAVSQRKFGIPPEIVATPIMGSSSETNSTSPQRSPRLMLPPPPPLNGIPRIVATTVRLVHSPFNFGLLRALLFVAKAVSLFLPCLPFAPSQWLMYTLLSMAAFDMGLLPFSLRLSAFLAALHLLILYSSQRSGLQTCEGL